VFAAAVEAYRMIGRPGRGCWPIPPCGRQREERRCWKLRDDSGGGGFSDATSPRRSRVSSRRRFTGWSKSPEEALSPHALEILRPCSGNRDTHRAPCNAGDLVVNAAGIDWRDGGVTAGRVVLAGGAADIGHPSLTTLPLRPVRGESLLVRIPDLKPAAAFVCGHHLVPVAGDLWSCGGTKVPGDLSPAVTAQGRAELENFLQTHLGVPWETV
jgi:hypothetical protein